MMKFTTNQNKQKQQGVVLFMALIMLLLITIIGLASVRMSSQDTLISGNSMFSLMVFQGAESALGKAVSENDLYNIKEAAANGTTTVPASYFAPTETVNGGGQLISSVEIEVEVKGASSPFGSTPNSTSTKTGTFRTTAESRLNATSARAKHTEGISVQFATD